MQVFQHSSGLQKRHVRSKRTDIYSIEPRRSSRARNPAPSYRDDVSFNVSSSPAFVYVTLGN